MHRHAFVFWLVLLLPWVVATFILCRARSVGFFECVVLGLSLNIALFGVWGVLSAALNLDHDFADENLREAVLAAFLLVPFGTVVVGIATGLVGLMTGSLRRSSAETTVGQPPRSLSVSLGAALRMSPELADPVGPLEVGERQDAEQLGAGGRAEGGEALPEAALKFVWSLRCRSQTRTARSGRRPTQDSSLARCDHGR